MVLKRGYTKDESYSVGVDETKSFMCVVLQLATRGIFNVNNKRASSLGQEKHLRTKKISYAI